MTLFKFISRRIIVFILLFCLPVIFLVLDFKIDEKNKYINSLAFILATLIVVMTTYVILRLVIKKFPSFLEKGIWENPFNTLIIGTLILFLLVMIILLGINNFDLNTIVTKLLTFAVAYPIIFILTVMLDAFYKQILKVNRKDRLLVSSVSIILILTIMILFAELSNMQ